MNIKKQIFGHAFQADTLEINENEYNLHECEGLVSAEAYADCRIKTSYTDEDGMLLGDSYFDWDLFEEEYLSEDFLAKVIRTLKPR